jgi:BASS family bile acid:Na+ symporter
MLLVLKYSISVLIFAVGLTATGDDIVHLWRRPVLLLKSVVAMYLVMPAAAVVMARVFDLPPGTELALVILAICAGAPLLPKKLIKFGGNPSYVFSLIVTTSLLAIATVPASLAILADVITFDTTGVTPAHVAGVILKTFLLPLGLGMLVRFLFPALADKISDFLLKAAGIVMALCALVVLAIGLPKVVEVGLPSLLAFALFTVIAILAGHLLGGPEPSDRTSLAVACASRHIGLALLVAANAPGGKTIALVVAYLLASAVVSIAYILWLKRMRKRGSD